MVEGMFEACARAPIINYYSIRISDITPVIFECGVIIIEMLVPRINTDRQIHTHVYAYMLFSIYVVKRVNAET